ncbi:MAG: hypothetical protein LBI67_12000 [Treponema sp.]|jgi:hypothetical protein|nr:hypothetical protein [Treponema sp.]
MNLGNASLLDVFRSATGLANQGLGIYSEQKKAELDAIYFERNVALQETTDRLAADFKAIDPEGNNAFQSDPTLYRAHVNKELQKWRDDSIKAGNNSKYYNDLVLRADMKAQAEMENIVHKAEVSAGIQKANVAWEKAYTSNLQRPLDPERDLAEQLSEKLHIALGLVETYGKINGTNIEGRKKLDDQAYNDFYTSLLGNNIQTTVEADEKYVEAVKSILPQDLPDRDSAAAKAVEERRNVIWTQNENAMFAADGDFQTLIRESVKNGKIIDYGKWSQAMAIRNQWLPTRDGLYLPDGSMNPQYNPTNISRLARTFEYAPVDGVKGSGSGSGGPEKGMFIDYTELKNLVKSQYQEWLQNGSPNGQSFLSFLEKGGYLAIAETMYAAGEGQYRPSKDAQNANQRSAEIRQWGADTVLTALMEKADEVIKNDPEFASNYNLLYSSLKMKTVNGMMLSEDNAKMSAFAIAVDAITGPGSMESKRAMIAKAARDIAQGKLSALDRVNNIITDNSGKNFTAAQNLLMEDYIMRVPEYGSSSFNITGTNAAAEGIRAAGAKRAFAQMGKPDAVIKYVDDPSVNGDIKYQGVFFNEANPNERFKWDTSGEVPKLKVTRRTSDGVWHGWENTMYTWNTKAPSTPVRTASEWAAIQMENVSALSPGETMRVTSPDGYEIELKAGMGAIEIDRAIERKKAEAENARNRTRRPQPGSSFVGSVTGGY